MDFAEQLTRVGLEAAEVLQSADVGVLVLAAEGTVLAANAAAERSLGWSSEQLVGLDVHDTVHAHPTSVDPVSACAMTGVAKTGRPAAHDGDLLRRVDGRLLPVSWTAAPLQHRLESNVADVAGGAVVVSFLDDTRRQAELVTEAASREQDRADLRYSRQAVSDLGWIAELTRVISSTFDEGDALLRLARLLTPRLADLVIVNRVDDRGGWHRVGGSVATGIGVDLDLVLSDPAVAHLGGGDPATKATAGSAEVVSLGRTQLQDPRNFGRASRTLFEQVDAGSLLIIPFAARGSITGFAGLIRQADNAYDAADVLLAADIGRRAGLALNNARLYRRQQSIASDLQLALLPEIHDLPGVQAAARYLPARDHLRVGGDWYDLFACPTDDALVAVIGDVAGHDLPAATTMAALRNLTRGIAVSATLGPAATLAAIDTGLAPLSIGGTATSLIVNVAPHEGGWRLGWANAGHPPGLLIEPAASGESSIRLIGSTPDPLLGTRSRPPRTDHHTDTVPGAVVLLYTDGLIERRHETLDQGLARLRQAVLATPLDLHPNRLLDGILDRLPRSPDDDTAIIALRLG